MHFFKAYFIVKTCTKYYHLFSAKARGKQIDKNQMKTATTKKFSNLRKRLSSV